MNSSHPQPPALDDLLAHAGWLRRLATSLVHDSGRAEDLAQEVFLIALREQPRGIQRPRAWLAAVARRLAITQGRSGARRARREGTRPAREPEPATDDLVAEAELGRVVARVVLDLHEPFRTVLLMRYWRDLPPRRIAAELERPVETVKVQLRRGLEHVRARLDKQHGDRKAWALLLAPLASPRTAVALPTGAGLLLAVGAVVGVAWVGSSWSPTRAPVLEAAAVPAATRLDRRPPNLAPPPATPPAVGVASLAERVPARAPEPTPAPPVAEPPAEPPPPAHQAPDWPLQRGCLRDLAGEPLGGVPLVVPPHYRPKWAQHGPGASRTPPPTPGGALSVRPAPEWKFATVSDAFGLFELHAPNPAAIVCTGDEFQVFGWARAQNQVWGQTHDLFATEAVRLCGIVVDDGQAPLGGLVLEFLGVCPPELRDFLPAGVGLQPTPLRVESEDGGRFCLSLPRVLAAPRNPDRPRQLFLIEHATVPVRQAPRFGMEKHGAAYIDQLDLSSQVVEASARLVFPHEPVKSTRRVSGHVTRPGVGAVSGAHVIFAGFTTRTDERGDFELEVGDVYAEDALAVYEVGRPPLVEEKTGWRVLRSGGRQQLRRLILPRDELTLTGVVVDSSGNPVSGRRYWLADPTYLEPLSGSLEAHAAGIANARTVTDAEGRFVIRGLLSRSYRIEVESSRGGSQVFGRYRPGRKNLRLVLKE